MENCAQAFFGLLSGGLSGGKRTLDCTDCSLERLALGILARGEPRLQNGVGEVSAWQSAVQHGFYDLFRDLAPAGEAALVGLAVTADERGRGHDLARRRRADRERALDQCEPALHPLVLLREAQSVRTPPLQGRQRLQPQEPG